MKGPVQMRRLDESKAQLLSKIRCETIKNKNDQLLALEKSFETI